MLTYKYRQQLDGTEPINYSIKNKEPFVAGHAFSYPFRAIQEFLILTSIADVNDNVNENA